MKQNLRGPSLISAFPQYGVPLDWGFSTPSENRCVGAEDPCLVICHMCVGRTLELELMIHGGLTHTHSQPPRSNRCIPLAVWATETNKKHF